MLVISLSKSGITFEIFYAVANFFFNAEVTTFRYEGRCCRSILLCNVKRDDLHLFLKKRKKREKRKKKKKEMKREEKISYSIKLLIFITEYRDDNLYRGKK